jgi:hypothetical protein
MVEPHPGHERAYNRYYEDDHYYSGAMAGPWVLSGRRWVATRALQRLRYPSDSPILEPLTAGCYLSLYLHSEGHVDDVVRWARTTMDEQLYPKGRGFPNRTNVYTSYCKFEFGVNRDQGTPLKAQHVLDHPFRGVVLEVVEPPTAIARGAWVTSLKEEVIPRRLLQASAAIVLAFSARPLPPSRTVPNVLPVAGAGHNLNLLWFLEHEPEAIWELHRQRARDVGTPGRLLLSAPFRPTLPGTDMFVDELR